MTKNFICFHGHFYQPPREDPWTGKIDEHATAAPFKDWNERINDECYRQLARLNVYEKISFNFGPTLLSWMKQHAADVYQAVLDADRKSCDQFEGCGCAMAQAYNHMILPLSSERDKNTQVYWGIKDFEHRFNRKPKGMWLPETAVDIATLEVLAKHGIEFTVLAPKQAQKIRRLGQHEWEDVSDSSIESKRPYRQFLPSGGSIDIFFYDANLSVKLAFGPYTRSLVRFKEGLKKEIDRELEGARLIHGAVDGETFGHHHKKGAKILSDVLDWIDSREDTALCNYEYFLSQNEPMYEVDIIENTAWSCDAGLNRWFMDDDQSYDEGAPGVHPWREKLRNSLDWLRGCLFHIYEVEMLEMTTKPWELRNNYIQYLLTNDVSGIESGLNDPAKLHRAMDLLEMQKMAMYMYTSCGWFFEDIARIETIQILRYAARAMQIAKKLSGLDLTEEFLGSLECAQSKNSELMNGKNIYLQFVQPMIKAEN